MEEGIVSMLQARQLDLDSLSTEIPVMTPGYAGYCKESCMVCLESQGHSSGVTLSVDWGGDNENLTVRWVGSADSQMKAAHHEPTTATDAGACAIALLLVRELTDYTAVQQAAIGTTVDYFLARRPLDDTLVFNHAARLEASGIREEKGTNTVSARANRRLGRLKDDSLPALIVIVEFASPKSKMVRS